MNLVYGGKDVNIRALDNPHVKGVGFIGSSAVGGELFAQAGRLGKEASINGNGKNHVVLMPDANFDVAINGLVRGCFGMGGQRCLGFDNILVVGDEAYDKFRDAFVKGAGEMKLGSGLDESTELGPLVAQRGVDKVLNFIDKGLSEGAKLALDGRSPKMPEGMEKGFFLAPTVFEDVTADMWIARNESFGPVANLIRVKDLDEALDLINNKDDYGHSACIFTSSGASGQTIYQTGGRGQHRAECGHSPALRLFPAGIKKRIGPWLRQVANRLHAPVPGPENHHRTVGISRCNTAC